jgi:hypothetical protein
VQEPLADNFAGVMLHACFLFGLSNHCFFLLQKMEIKAENSKQMMAGTEIVK